MRFILLTWNPHTKRWMEMQNPDGQLAQFETAEAARAEAKDRLLCTQWRTIVIDTWEGTEV
jgi:hypothetical protein